MIWRVVLNSFLGEVKWSLEALDEERKIVPYKAIINGISKYGCLYILNYFSRIYYELKKDTEIKS